MVVNQQSLHSRSRTFGQTTEQRRMSNHNKHINTYYYFVYIVVALKLLFTVVFLLFILLSRISLKAWRAIVCFPNQQQNLEKKKKQKYSNMFSHPILLWYQWRWRWAFGILYMAAKRMHTIPTPNVLFHVKKSRKQNTYGSERQKEIYKTIILWWNSTGAATSTSEQFRRLHVCVWVLYFFFYIFGSRVCVVM